MWVFLLLTIDGAHDAAAEDYEPESRGRSRYGYLRPSGGRGKRMADVEHGGVSPRVETPFCKVRSRDETRNCRVPNCHWHKILSNYPFQNTFSRSASMHIAGDLWNHENSTR